MGLAMVCCLMLSACSSPPDVAPHASDGQSNRDADFAWPYDIDPAYVTRECIDPLVSLSHEYRDYRECVSLYPGQWLKPLEHRGPWAKALMMDRKILAPIMIEHLDDVRETELRVYSSPDAPEAPLSDPLRVRVGVIAMEWLETRIGLPRNGSGMSFTTCFPDVREMREVKDRWRRWWQRHCDQIDEADVSMPGE